MEPEKDPLSLPPISTNPTDQHGQVMFVLGQLIGEVKGVQQRQDMTNGKVLKAGTDITALQQQQALATGKDIGISKVALVVLNVITALGLIITIYLKLKK